MVGAVRFQQVVGGCPRLQMRKHSAVFTQHPRLRISGKKLPKPRTFEKKYGMETTVEPKYRTIEEIKASYPGEWVLLGNPEKDGLTILGGVVLHHHPDKRELANEGRRLAHGYDRYRWVFAGEIKRMPRIGIFRKITLPANEAI